MYYPLREIEPDIIDTSIEVSACTDTPHSTGTSPKQWDHGTGILKKMIKFFYYLYLFQPTVLPFLSINCNYSLILTYP
jgi:hypothetical protein